MKEKVIKTFCRRIIGSHMHPGAGSAGSDPMHTIMGLAEELGVHEEVAANCKLSLVEGEKRPFYRRPKWEDRVLNGD